MKAGESVVLQFHAVPEHKKIRIIDREYQGKKSKAVEYDVIDPNTGEEKSITLSMSWALNLNELLKPGYRNIQVSRRGSSTDTNYSFVPV